MTQSFEKLLEVITTGFFTFTHTSAILAFVAMFFFVMHMAVGRPAPFEQKSSKSEIFWGFFSAISSFLLVSVFLFLIHTPLTQMAIYNHFMWGLNLGQFMTLLSLLGWLLLTGYLFLPIQEKAKISLEDEDDISFVPFIGVFFGFCLSMLTFNDVSWPSHLMSLVGMSEVVGQASFYGFIFVLPTVLIWSVLSFTLSCLTKRFFENVIPRFVPVALLIVAFIYQLVFQYL